MSERKPDQFEKREKNDFRWLEKNTKNAAKDMSIDERIDFINQINALAGHPVKKPAPIKGDKFLL